MQILQKVKKESNGCYGWPTVCRSSTRCKYGRNESKTEINFFSNEVRHLATAFLVMKVRELPPKVVFTEFLASERPCKLQRDVRDQMCSILDNDNQESQSMLQIETAPRKTDSKPEPVPSSSRQEFETVQEHLEHVYAGPQTQLFLLIELCQKLTDQVGTFDQFHLQS